MPTNSGHTFSQNSLKESLIPIAFVKLLLKTDFLHDQYDYLKRQEEDLFSECGSYCPVAGQLVHMRGYSDTWHTIACANTKVPRVLPQSMGDLRS
jgi:hypothetical protein